jgi:hypothetical protein
MAKLPNLEDLKLAIERAHGCKATFRESVPVLEQFAGATVWQGGVSVFDVDHPAAKVCYAWSAPAKGANRERIYAVLGQPPIDSPEAAVRASIVRDFHNAQ